MDVIGNRKHTLYKVNVLLIVMVSNYLFMKSIKYIFSLEIIRWNTVKIKRQCEPNPLEEKKLVCH